MPKEKKFGVGEDAVGTTVVDPVTVQGENVLSVDEDGNEWVTTPDGTRFML